MPVALNERLVRGAAHPAHEPPSRGYPSVIDSRKHAADAVPPGEAAARVANLADLAELLRALRRRHARRHGGAELTYREIAAATGWSHGIVGEYLAGRVLPPTDRFDALIRLFGATPAEQGSLATARDRVEENRRRTAPAGSPVVQVPRELPVDVCGFTGRTGLLGELHALLRAGGEPRPTTVAALTGTAGVGKTALAVHFAHRIADRFPDGQLYVDLRGFDAERPMAPADALARLLRSLGVAAGDVPGDLAERAARLRTVVSGRRVLMVLDNASGAGQVRPLLPGSASCFVVVTSRDDLAGLVAREGASRFALDVLTPAESVALLTNLIGTRTEREPAHAAALAEQCARLPLTLRIAGELALANPAMTLHDLLGDLRDRRLDALDGGGDPRTAIRSVFSWSSQHLSEAGAAAFSLLGLHPGRDIDAYAVAALAGTGLSQAQAAVDELARAHLIETAAPGRYGMHDLLREYAAERAAAGLARPERDAAVTRLLDHYAVTASAAAGALYPHERPGHRVPVDPPSPAPPVREPLAAGRWLDEQRANLIAGAVFAARQGWSRHAVDLSCALWRYLEVGGHYQDALAVHTAAAGAADADDPHRASALANLGGIHWWLGEHERAQGCFEQARAGYREAGDADGQARAAARLGLVHDRLGRYHEALAEMRDAMRIYRGTGNRHGEASQLLNLGTVHSRLGRLRAAAAHHRRAARIFAEIGDRRLEGYALGNLGSVSSLLGRHADALAHLERALARCREAGDRGGEGSALGTIGIVLQRMTRAAEAVDRLHEALAISRETGDRGLETEMLNTLGETLYAQREPAAAIAWHRSAQAVAEATGDGFEHARALDGIAAALEADGNDAQARTHWRQALSIYERLGVPQADRIRTRLAG